jgi:hypothetical protein
VVSMADPYGLILGFLNWSHNFFQVVQLYSRDLVDPMPDPLLRKSGISLLLTNWKEY